MVSHPSDWILNLLLWSAVVWTLVLAVDRLDETLRAVVRALEERSI